MSLFLRGFNWFKRFRHRCGYGVHSPSDFFFITFVVYEKLEFYAYKPLHELRQLVSSLPHHREKVDMLLFRVVNYLHPSSLLEIGTGSGLSTLYMHEAKPSMKVVSLDTAISTSVKKLFSSTSIDYSTMQSLNNHISKATSLSLVHIAHTDDYETILEQLLPYTGTKTCIIVSKPYLTKAKAAWWKTVVEDPRVGVTFDLYDLGLLFFDMKRIKEHRIVNFL